MQDKPQTVVVVIPSKKIQINSIEQAEAKALLDSKSHIETVTTIRIQGNSYSLQFCQSFQEILQSAKNIKDLNINDMFVSRLKEEIPKSIQFISRGLLGSGLLRLDISNNAVNPFGAQSLLIYLQQAKSLQMLLIYNCGLGPMGVAKIAQGLKGTPRLKSLSIGRNRMENEGIKSIAAHLQYVPNLEELFVYQNTLKEQGLLQLFRGLRRNCKNITSLDICDNFIRATATQQFVLLLKEALNLRNLNISDCLNQGENQTVIEGFKDSQNRNWQRIGYNFAQLDTQFALQLLEVLKSCPLKRLDIVGNDFNKKVKKAYSEAIAAEALSKFDDDDDEEEVKRLFEQTKI